VPQWNHGLTGKQAPAYQASLFWCALGHKPVPGQLAGSGLAAPFVVGILGQGLNDLLKEPEK